MPGLQMRRDSLCRQFDVTQIGLAILVQRRGDANNDGIRLRQLRVVRGRAETALAGRLYLGRGNVVDVGGAAVQLLHFAGVNVKTGDRKFFFAE